MATTGPPTANLRKESHLLPKQAWASTRHAAMSASPRKRERSGLSLPGASPCQLVGFKWNQWNEQRMPKGEATDQFGTWDEASFPF